MVLSLLPFRGIPRQYHGLEFATSLLRSSSSSETRPKAGLLETCYDNIMVLSLAKVDKILIMLQQLTKAGLLEAKSGKVMVLRLPKVCQDPPHAVRVDQKLASCRHSIAKSRS